MTLEEFAARLEKEQKEGYIRRYGKPNTELHPFLMDGACQTSVHIRTKYAFVDIGRSGRYCIPLPGQPDAGTIFGIKAYGIIHRGHKYGTLDTVDNWDWSEYTAVPKSK